MNNESRNLDAGDVSTGDRRHGAVHSVSGSVRQNLKRQLPGSTDDLHHVDSFGFSFCLSVYGAGKAGVVLIVFHFMVRLYP
jgi:hypothetical protein